MLFPEPIVQLAYVTEDAREAASRFSSATGAGPFHVVAGIELAECEVRGQPGDFVHTSAYGQWGALMVEFVQPDDERPSPLRELLRPGHVVPHHHAVIVDDLAATYLRVEAAGLALASRQVTRTGTEFAFVDTLATLGVMVEIYERSERLMGFYELVARSAEAWDGLDPVRELA